jgi:hypothetical protein
MYTLNSNTGVVTRDSDGVIVAPVDNPNNVNYLDYLAWVESGNSPTTVSYEEIITSMNVSKLAFRNRFTIQEKIQIDLMSLDNPNASMDVRMRASIIRVFFEDVDQAEYISLDAEGTYLALSKMVEFGILTETRVSEILNTPPLEAELPNVIV